MSDRFNSGRVGQTYNPLGGPQEIKWATLIPGRKPEFKIHKNRGQAANAVSQRMPDERCAMLEFVDGEWKFVMDYTPGDNCDRCGNRFDRNRYGYVQRQMDRPYVDKSLPVYMRDIICSPCAKAEQIDYYLSLDHNHMVPYNDDALATLIARQPEYRDKFNTLVERKHQADKERARIK